MFSQLSLNESATAPIAQFPGSLSIKKKALMARVRFGRREFSTVTDFTPGQTIVLKTEGGEPAHYKFSKTVTYQTADGRVIEPSKIRKDSKVRVHYLKSGDDMLVDKVIVTHRD